MGLSVYPAPVASSKTAYKLSLTSGSSWTVPAGVTYVNVTLIGGGGGGCSTVAVNGPGNAGGSGGTTTFTGATSAAGGAGAPTYARVGWGNVVSNAGISAPSNSGLGGFSGGSVDYTGSSMAITGPAVSKGMDGAIVSSIVNTTPGASISYSIGSGGSGGGTPSGGAAGGAGGSGRVDIEYWA